jgi:hypothetical protein
MDTEFYAFEHGQRQWELKSTLLFMMTSVLKSRTETGFESNSAGYDEDVNVYLAGLLAAYLDPAYTQWSSPLISPFDMDVATMVRSADERRRYWIYKANADHLMLMLGIFEPEPPAAPPAPPSLPSPTAPPIPAPPPAIAVPGLSPGRTRMYVGRGETYYELAASYGRGLARRPTAAIEVLEKLAGGFEGYVTILNHLRSHLLQSDRAHAPARHGCDPAGDRPSGRGQRVQAEGGPSPRSVLGLARERRSRTYLRHARGGGGHPADRPGVPV